MVDIAVNQRGVVRHDRTSRRFQGKTVWEMSSILLDSQV